MEKPFLSAVAPNRACFSSIVTACEGFLLARRESSAFDLLEEERVTTSSGRVMAAAAGRWAALPAEVSFLEVEL